VSTPPLDATFAPVRSQTAFEETMERIGTAIKLGLLQPGARLPPERELCARLGISRSTLRQALTALVQSGYLHAARGRGGSAWREACDTRMAVELGVATLAAERATADQLDELDTIVAEIAVKLEDFPAYRQADVRFHIGLAEATQSTRLVAMATEAQGAMTDLIAHIAHPPELLARSNDQHARMLDAIRARDVANAVRVMTEHVRGTEHVLAGLLPDFGPRGH
jgi:GntR family transcriptional repressor for pyruvate dehydrogenase complex